jgi:hypothetical protein
MIEPKPTPTRKKHMKKIMMLGAAVLALQAIPALAQDAPPQDGGMRHGGPGKFFQMQDANNDGVVTEGEFIASAKKRFAELDTDKNGKVTKEEMDAHRDEMRKKWESHRDEMKAKRGEAGKADVPAEAPKAE